MLERLLYVPLLEPVRPGLVVAACCHGRQQPEENLRVQLLELSLCADKAMAQRADRSKPTKLEFKEDGGKLVSSNALPEGNDFPVSVSIKPSASGKAVYEKFNLNLEKCPT